VKSSYVVPLAIIVGGAIVALAVYTTLSKQSTFNPGSVAVLVRPVGTADHILGNPGARVVIVEYCDFEGEFCKSFHDTLHQVIADEGTDGEVAWVFREFPLTEIHPRALSDAKAAECAGAVAGNDAFWKFADALFANQSAATPLYGELARTSGIIATDAFSSCFASASTTLSARIEADRRNALESGATGAPYSFILVAGKSPVVMEGAYSYDAVKQLLDQAFAK
jgi:protein-disulfide isomerase